MGKDIHVLPKPTGFKNPDQQNTIRAQCPNCGHAHRIATPRGRPPLQVHPDKQRDRDMKRAYKFVEIDEMGQAEVVKILKVSQSTVSKWVAEVKRALMSWA